MIRRQPFACGLTDTLLAEVGGVPLDALHHDVDPICRCYDAILPVAERLGLDPPIPRLAGFSYCHVSTLGAEVVFAPGSEPNVLPALESIEDIDALRPPVDYLNAGIVPKRLGTLAQLLKRRPDASVGIGHEYEGPITTAALLLGPQFFTLPYEDPERAHRLLTFGVESAIAYRRALRDRLGLTDDPGPRNICDDFAGMFTPELFPEFVLPYWDRMYEGLNATERNLHSELLRPAHLPFLKDLGIAVFDPSADQYVTPTILREQCPCPFTGRVQSWHIRDNSPAQLQHLYRDIAQHEPVRISFYMTFLEDEPKIAALLDVARELAGEG